MTDTTLQILLPLIALSILLLLYWGVDHLDLPEGQTKDSPAVLAIIVILTFVLSFFLATVIRLI